MKRAVRTFLLSLALVMPASAYANAPKHDSTHSDWSVYTRGSGSETVCFALTKAKTLSPSSVNHGDVYFMVSSWKNGSAKEQPSFLAGYGLKTNRAPKARVGSTTLSMYAVQQDAFIESSTDEKKLVAKMRAGATMTVSAVSQRGTNTSYEFSLKGVTAAIRKANSACA